MRVHKTSSQRLILTNIDSLDKEESESEDSLNVKPTKKKKVTDFFDKLPEPGAKQPIARKASGSRPQPTVKKPTKKAVDSEEDDSGGGSPVSVVRVTAPKRAARAAPKKYIEVESDSGDDDGGDGSTFDEDD